MLLKAVAFLCKMELKRQIMHGVLWNSVASFGIHMLNFVTKIIIARILFPEDFGLFAMAFLLINFLGMFVGFGMMNALIYKKEEYEKTKGTALLLSMMMGVCFFAISFLSSAAIGSFFNQPIVGDIIKVLSIVLLFDSISTILHGILLKEMEFKKKAITEFVSAICSSATVIVLALYGFGVWSLVWGYIIQHFCILILSWIVIQEKPKVQWNKSVTKELLGFGKYIVSTSLISWAVTSVDNIMVGKKLGEEPLGYYSMAFNIVALPVSSFTHLVMTVFYPVYAKLENDKERLKKAYLKPLEWSLVLMFPITVFLFFIPEKIVMVILGEKWVSIIPLLKIFAGYCIFRTICTIISQVLTGVGKPKVAAILLGIELCIIGVCIIPAIALWGLGGVAVVIVFARGVSALLHLWAVQKVVVMTMSEYWNLFVKKVAALCFMVIVVFVLNKVFGGNTWLALGTVVLFGLLTYFFVLFLLEKKLFEDFFKHLRIGVGL